MCTRCMGRVGTIKDLKPIILDSQGQASGCHFMYIFSGIPLFFYQIVSTPNFPIFAPFYFFTSQNIYFYFPEHIFLLFYCGYLCLVCVNVSNRG